MNTPLQTLEPGRLRRGMARQRPVAAGGLPRGWGGLGHGGERHPGRVRDDPGPLPPGLAGLAAGAGPQAGRGGEGPGGRAAAEQGGPGPAGDPGDGQDPAREPGRGPGDDRHLRLRRGPLPAALRPHHAQRAAPAPAPGAVAPARGGGRDHRLQLPRGGLELEHRPGPGLRRHGALEALLQDPPHGHRLHPPRRAGPARRSASTPPSAAWPSAGAATSATSSTPTRGWPWCPTPARCPGGRHVGRLVQERFGQLHPGAGRQQRGHRQRPRPTWTSPCGRSTSVPSAPPASAAPPPAGSSSTSPSTTPSWPASWSSTGRPASAIPWRTPPSWAPWWTQAAVDHHAGGHRDREGPGRHGSSTGGERAAEPRRLLRHPLPGRGGTATCPWSRRRPSRPCSTS